MTVEAESLGTVGTQEWHKQNSPLRDFSTPY